MSRRPSPRAARRRPYPAVLPAHPHQPPPSPPPPDPPSSRHPVSTAECVFAILFIMINIALAAFIVGTTTLLVVRRDTQTSQYRDQAASLRTYSQVNGLPPALTRSMHEHLRLSFANSDIADEAVLSTYPTTLRRRALRHLYLSTVRRCYLFAGARQRFIDALLSAASVELLMPGVGRMFCEG